MAGLSVCLLYSLCKTILYDRLQDIVGKGTVDVFSIIPRSPQAQKAWEANGDYIGPWLPDPPRLESFSPRRFHLSNCSFTHSVVSPRHHIRDNDTYVNVDDGESGEDDDSDDRPHQPKNKLGNKEDDQFDDDQPLKRHTQGKPSDDDFDDDDSGGKKKGEQGGKANDVDDEGKGNGARDPAKNSSDNADDDTDGIDDVAAVDPEVTAAEAIAKGDKPNIVFILSDDLGWTSDRTYDLDFVTPFLDRLARRSVVLTKYYSQEASTPTRAALLTGRYPIRLGMQFGEVEADKAWGLDTTETLLPQVLKTAGYTNYMVGKWQLGHHTAEHLPTARGFDYFVGSMVDSQYNCIEGRDGENAGRHSVMYANTSCYAAYDASDVFSHPTLFYGGKAVEIINSHNYSHPMFLFMSIPTVWNPNYDDEESACALPVRYKKMQLYKRIFQDVVGPNRRQFAVSLALLDEMVSIIHDALIAADQLERTYIVVS